MSNIEIRKLYFYRYTTIQNIMDRQFYLADRVISYCETILSLFHNKNITTFSNLPIKIIN